MSGLSDRFHDFARAGNDLRIRNRPLIGMQGRVLRCRARMQVSEYRKRLEQSKAAAYGLIGQPRLGGDFWAH